MTLLITAFAAVIATIAWYTVKADRKLGTLALMYWGASLMWLVDSVVEYIGLSVVALGLIIWVVVLIVKDPDGKVRAALARR